MLDNFRKHRKQKINFKKYEEIKPQVERIILNQYNNFKFNLTSTHPKINFNFPSSYQLTQRISYHNYFNYNSPEQNAINIYSELLRELKQDFLNHNTVFDIRNDLELSIGTEDFWNNERYYRKTSEGRKPKDWKTRREVIFKRDKSRCQRCGKIVALEKCHIHHIIRRSEGGDHSFENLVTLCHDCHTIMDGHENMRAYKTYYISSKNVIHRYGCRYSKNLKGIKATYPSLLQKDYTSCEVCKPWNTHQNALNNWRPSTFKIPIKVLVFERVSITIS